MDLNAGDKRLVALSRASIGAAFRGQTGGSLGEVARVWDFVAQRDLISLGGCGTWTAWTAFSPDGNTVLAVSWAGVAELWRAPAWKEIGAAEKGNLDGTGGRDL